MAKNCKLILLYQLKMSRILRKNMVCYYDIKCMMVLHEKKERKIKEKSKECNADSPPHLIETVSQLSKAEKQK